MTIVICPGVHPPEFTQNFLTGLGYCRNQVLILPTKQYPGYSACGILRFLQAQTRLPTKRLLFIAFSAGVVGAAGAAILWQHSGGTVKALIALDGWGVPLFKSFLSPFPVHRISHDPFTDWSSHLLGGDGDRFYADPPVSHLHLWRFPQATQGWWLRSSTQFPLLTSSRIYSRTTVAQFICSLIDRYEEDLG